MTRPALLESTSSVTDAVGGTLYGSGDSPITAITIDSRECGEGSLFVALPGERTDGHAFVADALRAGAAMAIVRSSYVTRNRGSLDSLLAETGGALCVVRDPLSALQQFSRERLRSFADLTRIAVTGSNGKTTTKELIASVLSRKAPTFKTRGNYNSEIGVPLSIFEVSETHTFGVFECAMNHVGEMEVLADIVRPELAVITNIGTAHIGLVGSQEGIAREKRRIFSRFDGTQTAVIYEDDAFRALLEEDLDGTVLLFGPETTPGFEGARSLGIEGMLLRWRGRDIRLPLPGRHNVLNALAAIRVALHFGCTDEEIQLGLENARAEFGRGEVYRGAVTVIQDSYNANAESMREAIRLLAETPHEGGRRILVLGAMYELGRYAAEHHRRVAEEAAASAADLIILFGPEFAAAAEEVGDSRRIRYADGFEGLVRLVADSVQAGDLVLLKGSRGTRLERLLPLLTEGRA
ncbi:MAG: UDP-N-acetylmuramoyl-tripeptide--D-alanyl-D-alanine ligase [Spirochaetaceae bacterium]